MFSITVQKHTSTITLQEKDRNKARELQDAANNVLKVDYIAEYMGFFESSPLVEYLHGEYTMDKFAFEPLHNLHPGISKQWKRCIYDLLLHNRHRTIILNACNDLLALYQKYSYVKDLQFNYTSSEKGMHTWCQLSQVVHIGIAMSQTLVHLLQTARHKAPARPKTLDSVR